MPTSIRPIQEDELPAFVEASATAFLDRLPVAVVVDEIRGLWDLRRVWAAFDGDRLCGTFRSWPSELTVPGGGRLPVTAVTNVTVLPTHRRRGLLRAMAAAEHRASRERGEAGAILWAAEYPIYGNLGYGPATRTATWTIDTHHARVSREPAGTLDLATPDEATRDVIRGVYEAGRGRQAGSIRLRDITWDDAVGLHERHWGERWNGYVLVHRDEHGKVDGYVRYRAKEVWEGKLPRGTITVDDLQALDAGAYRDLWRYLVSVDLVARVTAERRRTTEPLPWLLDDARAASLSDIADGLWIRIFDVVRALETRTYERPGSLVLEVVDDEAVGGRTRVLLDATPDGAVCRTTRRSPDLRLPITALGAAYLGGSRLRDVTLWTGVDEFRAGALTRADALLRATDEPWCTAMF